MIFAEDSNNEQSEFDTIVGCIEDIVIGEKFQDLQVSFQIFQCQYHRTIYDIHCERNFQIERNACFSGVFDWFKL